MVVVVARRLSALDASFLALETDDAPLHVGALLVLEGPAPDEARLRSDLGRRVSAVPACRRRIRSRRADPLRPMWVEQPGFVPEQHLHLVRPDPAAAHPPSDEHAAWRDQVVDLMSRRLDTARPPWEVWQLGGTGDRWAILVKAHHSLVDGVTGSGLLAALLAPDPSGQPARGRSAQVRAAAAAPLPPRAVTWRERARRLRQAVRTVAVPDLPPSVLNGPVGSHRSWDWVTVDLDNVTGTASRAGCTVNDVYLAALAGGLRSVLRERSLLAPATRVRVIVPVSLHGGGADARQGNLDAAIFVELPVHLGTARERLADVAAQTRRAKADGVALATEALVRAADAVPAPVLRRAARSYVRRGQARVNLAASDVRGPVEPLSLCGCRVLEVVPCTPLALDVRVTSALMSYAGRASLAVTVDSAVLPDAAPLLAAVVDSLAELGS
ncbi:MAG: DUF1298 domain-containing protein [Frankiales bacterium]|nr:DUF1298 domain-containing protein [Frankiales bacterium]